MILRGNKKTTLFIRDISSEHLDDGRSKEIIYMEPTINKYIMSVLKSYNINNQIIFIGDDSAISDTVMVNLVKKDSNDTVNRNPLFSCKELLKELKVMHIISKDMNIERYECKKRIQNKVSYKLKFKCISIVDKLCPLKYKHFKEYN